MGIFDFFKSAIKPVAKTIADFNTSGGAGINSLALFEDEFFNSGNLLLDEVMQHPQGHTPESIQRWTALRNRILQSTAEEQARIIAKICERLPLASARGAPEGFFQRGAKLGNMLDEITRSPNEAVSKNLSMHFGTIGWACYCYHAVTKSYYCGDGAHARVARALVEHAPAGILKANLDILKALHHRFEIQHNLLLDNTTWKSVRDPLIQALGIADKDTMHFRLRAAVRARANEWKTKLRDVAGPEVSSFIFEPEKEQFLAKSQKLNIKWKAVEGFSPEQRGQVLLRCLAAEVFAKALAKDRLIIDRGSNLDVTHMVMNESGYHGYVYAFPAAIGWIAGMQLALSDDDYSNLLAKVPDFAGLSQKKILSQAFACCKAGGYPKTYAALRALNTVSAERRSTKFKSLLVGFEGLLAELDEARAKSAPRSVAQPSAAPVFGKAQQPSAPSGISAERQQYLKSIEQSILKQGQLPETSPVRKLSSSELALFCEIYADSVGLYKKSTPTAKWLKDAGEKFADNPALSGLFVRLLEDEFEAPATTWNSPLQAHSFHNECESALRGLIYLSAHLDAVTAGKALSDFARKTCFKTDPGVGIHNEKLGNACLWALINRADGQGVSHLARLLVRIKYPKVKKKIELALDEAALKAGVSRGELEEMALSDYGLDADGRVVVPVGEGSATISLDDTASTSIVWQRNGGKPSGSIPEALKPEKGAIKQVRDLVKEIDADVSVLTQRIQHAWLENRSWPIASWLSVYAGHPLRVPFAKRLIWNVERNGKRTSVTWSGKQFCDVSGVAINSEETTVSLWHPVHCPTAETLAWRSRLRELEITQPFKQAHREVYIVTDAERRTGTYSNRFAGHIIKQHQFMTLARINNWRVTHKISADVRNDEPAHQVLRAFGMVAEYWTEPAGGDDAEFNDALAYLYLSTDQLRFFKLADGPAGLVSTAHGPAHGDAVRIEDVPPIVLSEVMRHCDLFTGVASVASDPNWMDGGEGAQHHNQWRRGAGADYWRSESVGQLSASAETRKVVLEELLPSLKIGKQCKIDGRFLHVKGTLRSYKIHLGSGNILMEPNDAYLCIVPSSKGEGKIRLPFEGDKMLSIILSKAFMLAADDKITDSSIISQINRR